jgi:hypothetical protein
MKYYGQGRRIERKPHKSSLSIPETGEEEYKK